MRRILRRHLPGVKSIHSPTEVSYTRAISKNASLRYSVDLIAFKFTIDKRTKSMVPFRVLSRTNLADPSRRSNLNPRPFKQLQPLGLVQKSQLLCNQANPASFCKTPGVGVPVRELVRCTEAQKCLSVSPLLATLTHSVSRKSFPCHSYENTQDGGVTFAPVSASVSSRFGGKPSATPHKSQLYARPVFVAATTLQSLLPRAQSASTLNLSVRRRRAKAC